MFKYINGLCAVVYDMMGQEINRISIYLFCGIRFDRIKIILKEQDGITLLYKHLDMKGRYRCTRNISYERTSGIARPYKRFFNCVLFTVYCFLEIRCLLYSYRVSLLVFFWFVTLILPQMDALFSFT